MEIDLFLTNLNTVKEMILDEEKLVTYITVSKDLCMHVNNSKKLLHSVIQKIREELPNLQLNINYIISGIYADNSAIVTICTENELDQLRKTLKIIFFYHVYSVCKGSPSVDNAALFILNKFEDFGLCIGSIKSNECDKRTIDEIGNLKTNSQEGLILQSKPKVVVNKVFKQEVNKHASVEDIHEQDKDIKSVKKAEIKTETIKNDISGRESSINTQSNQKMNGHKTQKGIASFFNKPNGVQNKKAFNNSRENKLDGKTGKPPKAEEQKVNVPKDDSISENLTYKENPIVAEATKKEFQSDKELKNTKKTVLEVKDKVQNNIKKSLKADKKRKRVIQVSDSESDEEKDPFLNNLENNHESDDEIPPTPLTNNNIKVTSGFINPKKRRKVIDKTYTDQNGYMLTKKEEVYESCSENEDVTITEIESKSAKEFQSNTSTIKKNSPTKAKKKISPPQKGKQQTLNNFFHKK